MRCQAIRPSATPNPYETWWPSCIAPAGGIPQVKAIHRLFWIHFGGYVLPELVLTFVFIVLRLVVASAAVSFSHQIHQVVVNPAYSTRDDNADLNDVFSTVVFVIFIIFIIVAPIGSWICGAASCENARRLACTITEASSLEIVDPIALPAASHPTPQLIQQLNRGQAICFWVNSVISLLRAILMEGPFSGFLGPIGIFLWIGHCFCYYSLLTKMRTHFILSNVTSPSSLEDGSTLEISDDHADFLFNKEQLGQPAAFDPNAFADNVPFITFEATENQPLPPNSGGQYQPIHRFQDLTDLDRSMFEPSPT